jgi:hypothetical protein
VLDKSLWNESRVVLDCLFRLNHDQIFHAGEA